MDGYTLLIATHAVIALVCLLLGGYQLVRRVKGDTSHRIAGWVWTSGMTYVATSSFAVRELRHGQFSLLHVLSVVTLVSLLRGIVAARRHKITRHRAAMRGSWLGLLGAFVAAVAVPGRRIPTFAIDHPVGAVAAVVAVLALTVALILAAHLADRLVPGRSGEADQAARDVFGAPSKDPGVGGEQAGPPCRKASRSAGGERAQFSPTHSTATSCPAGLERGDDHVMRFNPVAGSAAAGRWRSPSAAPTPSSPQRSTPTPPWGRRPWAQRLCRRMRADELLTVDRPSWRGNGEGS